MPATSGASWISAATRWWGGRRDFPSEFEGRGAAFLAGRARAFGTCSGGGGGFWGGLVLDLGSVAALISAPPLSSTRTEVMVK